MNYDLRVSDAKRAVTAALCRQTKGGDLSELASSIDELNKAWDSLTDALVRQRDERGEQVLRLMNDLAEAKKGR